MSLDRTDVDERLNRDMQDYISLRINRSQSIRANITPPSTQQTTAAAAIADVEVGQQANSPQVNHSFALTCFAFFVGTIAVSAVADRCGF